MLRLATRKLRQYTYFKPLSDDISVVFRRCLSEMECRLLCADQSHDPVILPNLKPVAIGRGPATKITDKSLSRNQVELTADVSKQEVLVQQLGTNPCTAGGRKLKKDEKTTLGQGGKICLLHDKYPHFIHFIKTTDSSEELSDQNKTAVSGDTTSKEAKQNNLMQEHGMESPRKETSRKVKGNILDMLGVKRKHSDESGVNSPPSKRSCSGASTGSSAWEEFGGGKLIIYTQQTQTPRKKLALFDIDYTLIESKSGKKWAVDHKDWKFIFPEIPKKLRELHEDNYRVVLISNQNWVGKVPARIDSFKIKVQDISSKLGIPLQAYISLRNGIYRKPMTGMWTHLINQENTGVDVDLKECFFVGDAAGRPAEWAPGKKKDFSCSDRTFAANIGLKFFTPEEYFKNAKPARFEWPSFDPRQLASAQPIQDVNYAVDKQEVVVLVGFPGCGKSTFARNHLVSKSYVHISRDKLGSWQKCVQQCRAALAQGKSVVVDNTSPDVESRARYVKCARDCKVPVRCFVMDVTMEHAKHNNRIREVTDKNHAKVTDMVYNKYKSVFQEPTAQEGFEEVLRIPFIPTFKDASSKQLYCQFS